MKLNPATIVVFAIAFAALIGYRHFGTNQPQAYLSKNADFTVIRKQIASTNLQISQPSARSAAMAQLGRKLFFDPRLSANGRVACATCHLPDLSFTDGLKVGKGLAEVEFNTPPLINLGAIYWFFWDGRVDSLASQALKPLEDGKEHGFSRSAAAKLIVNHYQSDYADLFGAIDETTIASVKGAAHPAPNSIQLSDSVIDFATSSITDPSLLAALTTADEKNQSLREKFLQLSLGNAAPESQSQIEFSNLSPVVQSMLNVVFANIGKAIEAYELGLVATDSPFDRFRKAWVASEAADPSALFSEGFGANELSGFMIFAGKAKCTLCHSGGAFTDSQFHNIGLPQRGEKIQLGRSVGIQKVLDDPFNCLGPYLGGSERQRSESCLDLPYLDPETPEAIGSFKTPTLRNVALTGPYMHDGRFDSLREVIDHYNLMNKPSAVGFKEETLKPLSLTEFEKLALESFLVSLSSEVLDLNEVLNKP